MLRFGLVRDVDDVRDLAPTGPAAVLSDQLLADLERVQRIRELDRLPTRYAIAWAPDGLRGVIGIYPTRAPHLRALKEIYGDQPPEEVTSLGSDGAMHNVLPDDAELIRYAVRSAPALGSGPVCFPLLSDEQLAYVRSALPGEADLVSQTHDAVVEVTWPTFKDYLAGLSKPKERGRERQLFLDSGLVIAEEPLRRCAEELAPLLAQVERKYGGAGPEEARAFLRSIAASMGRSGTALVTRDGDAPVAFSVLWERGQEWVVRGWGCDYAYPRLRERYVYFNTVLYEPVARAITAGAPRLNVGRGSIEAKVRRGAKARPLWNLGWSEARGG